jgi:membrane fusion protein, heavy metal efflux system
VFASIRSAFPLRSLAAAIFAAIGAASTERPAAQTAAPLALSETVRIAVPGAGARLPILNSLSDQTGNPAPVIAEDASPHIREGQPIKIPQDSPLRSELTIAAVAATEIQRRLTVPGVVEADPSRTVQVLAPVAGRVIDLKIQLGDRVVPAQELALVYAGAAQANSRDRRARSRTAPTNEPAASDRQTGPQSDLSDAATDCQRMETEPQRSTARLCALIKPAGGFQETRLFSLRAPVAGSVIDLGIRSGTMLDDPSSSIMRIADLDTVWVTTSLRKKDAPLIAPGRPVEIAFIAYPNELFVGEARSIGDTLDPCASSITVGIELSNPSRRLKPNMSALVTLSGPKETVPIIPATGLMHTNNRDWVFVEVDQWTFEARPVEVSSSQDDQTVVVSGLSVGERIIVMGGALLED